MVSLVIALPLILITLAAASIALLALVTPAGRQPHILRILDRLTSLAGVVASVPPPHRGGRPVS
jgi:hypothetical protein